MKVIKSCYNWIAPFWNRGSKNFIQNKMNANMKIISDRSIASNIVIKVTFICKIKFCKTQRVREHGWDWKFIVIFMYIKSLPKSTDTQWKFDKWRAFSVGKKVIPDFVGYLVCLASSKFGFTRWTYGEQHEW